VVSDYGNYAYRWNARGLGGNRDIREFVVNCDNGYLMSKLAPRDEYDGRKTLKAVRRYILDKRKDGSLDAADAREEWDLLRHSGLDSDYDFARWLDKTKICDAYEMACYTPSAQVLAFFERAWPRLKALIEADLGKEMPHFDTKPIQANAHEYAK
jgi:hypothetical protein